MSPKRAVQVSEDLIDGIHPITGELLPDDNICEQSGITGALVCAIHALNEKLAVERAGEV